jgi:hypothetical protein
MPNETCEGLISASIDRLWKNILGLRSFAEENISGQSVEAGDRRELWGRWQNLVADIEAVRPFVGESIWDLYDVYRTFALRQVMKAHLGPAENRPVAWDQDVEGKPDAAAINLLGAIFTGQELAQINPEDRPGDPLSILYAIELRILAQMNDWIFNRRLPPIDIEKQLPFAALIQKARWVDIDGVGKDTSYGLMSQLTQWQEQMNAKIEAVDLPPGDKGDIKQQIDTIKKVILTDKGGNPRRLEKLINTLAVLSPDIFQIVIATLANPLAGIGLALNKIGQRAKLDARPA